MQLFLNSSPVKKREMLIARDKCDTKWEPKQSRHNSRGCTPHPVLNAVQASLLTCTCTCGSILGKQQLLLLMRSYLWESNNVLLEIPSNMEPRSWSADQIEADPSAGLDGWRFLWSLVISTCHWSSKSSQKVAELQHSVGFLISAGYRLVVCCPSLTWTYTKQRGHKSSCF